VVIDSPRPEPGDNPLETTAVLLAKVRDGDVEARNRLAKRYLPVLQRLTRGRLPARARDLMDTDDLVQVTLLKALDKVETFEPRREGAFLAYLRTIVQNRIRDEIRRVDRRPAKVDLEDSFQDPGPSPLELAVGKDALRTYEKCLSELTEKEREAVVLRLELGMTYEEIAEAVESPSGNAARMMISRAVVQLAERMNERSGE